MKKVLLIFICILLSISLSGCKEDSNRLQFWTQLGDGNPGADIIYYLDSEPTKIIKGEKYWDRENAILNIKFGWNSWHGINFERNDCILVTFGIYLLYDDSTHDSHIYDDYYSHEDGFLIGKIEKEEFITEKYKATLGERIIFSFRRPTFNIENEGFELKINSELIEKINKENRESIDFKFIVAPVYLLPETGKYEVFYSGRHDGIGISISIIDENMIKIYA